MHAPSVAQADLTKRPFSMQVRVAHRKRFIDLVDSLPLAGGAEIYIETQAPASTYATLFLRGSSGKLELLTTAAPTQVDQSLRFPKDTGKAVKLAGPAGNELVLLLARRAGPDGADDVRQLLAGVGAWPTLPQDAAMGVSPAGIKVLQKSRDLGPVVNAADPEEVVQKGLEDLARHLGSRCDYFEALVFARGE